MPSRPLVDRLDPGWAKALAPVEREVHAVEDFLAAEVAAGRGYLPGPENVLRAFTYPFDAVRVLIVGQDPYPTPGNSMGLAFSVAPDVHPLPPSLRNIVTELVADVGCAAPSTGDLTPWAEQGVLLLNRVLTVEPRATGSHRRRGWEPVTQQAIEALVERQGPLVAVLWGRDAQTLRPMLSHVPIIESVHPSPLSAYRGFFGSRPFTRVNALLAEQAAEPIDWALPG